MAKFKRGFLNHNPGMDFRMIWGFARPWRWTLGLCTLLMLAQTGVSLAIPWLGGQFAGQLLAGQGRSQLPLLGWLLVFFAGQALLRFLSVLLLGTTAERILADLRTRLYDHIQALPLAFHQDHKKGDVLALLTHDIGQLAHYISGTLLGVLPTILTMLGAMWMMMRIDLVMGALVAALVPVFFMVLKWLGRELRPLSKALQSAHADTVALAEENLGMIHAIKTYTREQIESSRYRGLTDRVLGMRARQTRIYAALSPAIQFLAAASVVGVLWLLASASLPRTPGETISFLLYAALLTRPAGSLADLYGQTRQIRGTLEKLSEVLAAQAEPQPSQGRVLQDVRGEIRFEDVSFTYPGREQTLDRVGLTVAAGQTLALTGPNGAGKSTLTHLLLRLMTPASGRILIDGVDIAELSLASLRSQIGVVPQQVQLFHGTVWDNIAWGKPEASRDEVLAAARKAQAHDFIAALPQGFETRIGDQGVKLSGGQRQRIALARALLKDPPILILDEATAMFDPQAEESFIHDCHDSFSRRTVILITHRPASLRLADRIVRMEHGRAQEVVKP